MDESRKRFEQFLKDEHHYSDDELFWEEDRNCYSIYPVHIAWKAWEASRASIEIELPSPQPDCFGFMAEHFNTTLEECAKAIHAAGIKVKE
ncbi:TPA: hypothetical protein ACXJR4_006187 [Pseudomonas aeruginosa]